MGEPYTNEELSLNLVTAIIRDYIQTHLNIADTGEPSGLDKKTWEQCIEMIRHLWLAEPHLPAMQVIDALKFAGWNAPEGGEL